MTPSIVLPVPIVPIAKTISATDTIEVALPAITSEVVVEPRSTITFATIPATVTRVVTVNKLLALLIPM